jgi:gliding motility-associated-like protein
MWSLTSGSASFVNVSDPITIVSNLQSGANILTWTISNGVCPTTSDSITIYIDEVKIPNGFSPNGDNINDNYEIPGLWQYTNVEFNVFNRWGNLVYSNPDYSNNWDGKNINGDILSDDTYYFTLKLSDENIVTGYLVLKRE